METTTQRLSAGMLAGMNLVMNRFTGPGKVGLQSMYLHVPSGEQEDAALISRSPGEVRRFPWEGR